MQKRRLGRTNHMSSVVIFGAAALWSADQEEANKALDTALAAGVNHIDVAPQYGKAEELVGPWLESRRDQFFLGCKTLMRDRQEAWDELHRSLKKLHTDHVDLYQLHAITSFEELDQALAPEGAIEAFKEAREKGLTRFLGITGHGMQTPAIFAQALERFDFDTVMFPLNPQLYGNPDYRRDAERLLTMCGERDVGVQIIKSIAKQPWGDREKTYNPWYEPFDTQEKISQGVRFVLTQPHVTAIPSVGDTGLMPLVLQAAENFSPMTEEEQSALIEEVKSLELIF